MYAWRKCTLIITQTGHCTISPRWVKSVSTRNQLQPGVYFYTDTSDVGSYFFSIKVGRLHYKTLWETLDPCAMFLKWELQREPTADSKRQTGFKVSHSHLQKRWTIFAYLAPNWHFCYSLKTFSPFFPYSKGHIVYSSQSKKNYLLYVLIFSSRKLKLCLFVFPFKLF